MADHILGPLYPALLAREQKPEGLRVVHADGLIGTYIGPDPYGVWVMFDRTLEERGSIMAPAPAPHVADEDDLSVDYADPHTRDRVARARFGVPWDRDLLERAIESERDAIETDETDHEALLIRLGDLLWGSDDEGEVCRAVAAAVWGSR